MIENYEEQIKLLEQLDKFNSTLENLLEDVPAKTRADLLREVQDYVVSRKRDYVLKEKNQLDYEVFKMISTCIDSIKQNVLFKTSDISKAIGPPVISARMAFLTMNKNKSRLDIVNFDLGGVYYWIKPLDKVVSIPSLRELKNMGKFGKNQGKYTDTPLAYFLRDIRKKGYTTSYEYYFSYPARERRGLVADYDHGRELLRKLSRTIGIPLVKVDDECVLVYDPKRVKKVQFE